MQIFETNWDSTLQYIELRTTGAKLLLLTIKVEFGTLVLEAKVLLKQQLKYSVLLICFYLCCFFFIPSLPLYTVPEGQFHVIVQELYGEKTLAQEKIPPQNFIAGSSSLWPQLLRKKNPTPPALPQIGWGALKGVYSWFSAVLSVIAPL